MPKNVPQTEFLNQWPRWDGVATGFTAYVMRLRTTRRCGICDGSAAWQIHRILDCLPGHYQTRIAAFVYETDHDQSWDVDEFLDKLEEACWG